MRRTHQQALSKIDSKEASYLSVNALSISRSMKPLRVTCEDKKRVECQHQARSATGVMDTGPCLCPATPRTPDCRLMVAAFRPWPVQQSQIQWDGASMSGTGQRAPSSGSHLAFGPPERDLRLQGTLIAPPSWQQPKPKFVYNGSQTF